MPRRPGTAYDRDVGKKAKLAIVGAGGVGATVAYACMVSGVADHLVLYDRNPQKLRAQVLDLNHGLSFTPAPVIEGADDLQICSGADVVVIAAGAKHPEGQTRHDLAATNAAMFRSLLPPLLAGAPQAVFLIVTNPVDVLTYVAGKIGGLPRNRVMGSGTVLDSARLRFLVARQLDVAVQNVHAYVVGEHGDSEVALWSSATIGGIPLERWGVSGRASLDVGRRAEIVQSVRNAGYEIIAGKGATTYAVALATEYIIRAIVRDQNRVLPVSSLLEDHRQISDVCLSVPCIVNRAGVGPPLPVPLSAEEEAALKHSAEVVRQVIRSVGF
jgi:L-lactate dehydrogenase